MTQTDDLAAEEQMARGLTVIPQKLRLYLQDIDFREALLRLSYAGDRPPIEFARQLTCFVIKPDGIVCRKGAAILDFMLAQGLMPVGVRRLRLRHQTMHAIWRYQWNRAAMDRIRLSTLMGSSADSLLVAVADPRRSSAVPLAVRLWALKGTAFAAERQPHHLRTHLGINGRFFGYVHLPDEPADLIRELGLMFPADGLSHFLLGLEPWRDATSEALRELRQLESETEPLEIDDELSLARLRERMSRGELEPKLAEQFSAATKDRHRRASITLAGIDDACFFRRCTQLDWDLVVVAATRVLENLRGLEPLINSGEAETAVARWAARAQS
jgi:hypothetical protein